LNPSDLIGLAFVVTAFAGGVWELVRRQRLRHRDKSYQSAEGFQVEIIHFLAGGDPPEHYGAEIRLDAGQAFPKHVEFVLQRNGSSPQTSNTPVDRKILHEVSIVGSLFETKVKTYELRELDALIQDRVERMLQLARALVAAARTVRQELLRHATQETLPQTQRLLALKDLFSRFGDSTESYQAARGCLMNSDPEIRLHAALQLGREATRELQGMAEDHEVPDGLRARAFKGVVSSGSAPPHLFETFIQSKSEELCRVAILAVGSAAVSNPRPSLADPALASALSETLAVELCRALARTGDDCAEDQLLRLLKRPEIAVQVAAASALSKVGSPSAINVLLTTAATGKDDELSRTANASIELIRNRSSVGGYQGQLSLSNAGTRGDLGIASTVEGAIGLARTDAEPGGELALNESAGSKQPAPDDKG
jgi:hypothetical protein